MKYIQCILFIAVGMSFGNLFAQETEQVKAGAQESMGEYKQREIREHLNDMRGFKIDSLSYLAPFPDSAEIGILRVRENPQIIPVDIVEHMDSQKLVERVQDYKEEVEESKWVIKN